MNVTDVTDQDTGPGIVQMIVTMVLDGQIKGQGHQGEEGNYPYNQESDHIL